MHDIGRTHKTLLDASNGIDNTFASQRVDGQSIVSRKFEHCTFTSVSFLKSKLANLVFIDCVFFACYFRRAEMKSCQFIGCRFIDCKFPNTSIQLCQFQFSHFSNCAPNADEMRPNLPVEAGIRLELAKNLYIESDKIGQWSDARSYHNMLSLAREEHYISVVLSKSSYYKTHYDLLDRGLYFLRLIVSVISGQSWGHGENYIRIIRNLAILILMPALFYYFGFVQYINADGSIIDVIDMVPYGAQSVLPIPEFVQIKPAGIFERALTATCSALGLVFLALLASYIFRGIRRR